MQHPSGLEQYTDEAFCYLTTTGRVSGKDHEIEIWFALDGTTLYMLAGNRERSDWVKNIQRQPAVRVRIRDQVFSAQGRLVDESSAEAIRARELVGPKYDEWQPGQAKTGWTWEALPVAIDLEVT
jgi:deazaflavin-dependent oxidoreductase (nitroreductase family)